MGVIWVHKAVDDYHGAGGVCHVDCAVVFVVRLDFDGGVHFAGGCSPNQDRDVYSLLLEFARVEHHFVQTWRD